MQALTARLVIFGIIAFALYIKFRREFMKISNKRKAIVLLTISLLFGILQSIPFEAPFLKFKTAEKSFEYSYFGEKIFKLIELNDSAFIIYGRDENELKYTIIPRKGAEWSYINPSHIQKDSAKFVSKMFVFSVTNPSIGRTIIIIVDSLLKNPIEYRAITDRNDNEFQKEIFKYRNVDYYSVVYWQSIESSEKKDYKFKIDGTLVNFR